MTDHSPAAEPAFDALPPAARRPSWGWLKWLGPAVVAAGLLSWGVAIELAETIDDDPDFAPGKVAEGQSRAIAMAAQLVFREIETHKWVANDPFFQPGWALDDMPAFQQGIVTSVSHFANEMNLAAIRAGEPDINLERAAGYLKYPGNIWMFDPAHSWAPTASSEKQYRSAARNLVLFNEFLLTGESRFDRGPQALKALLGRIGADLDHAAAELDAAIAARPVLADTRADDLFYSVKGRVYAHSLLLRELGQDFAPLLASRELAAGWGPMVESLRRAAALRPLAVVNGAPDSALLPSHLAAQGFHLLRARSQLAAIAAALPAEH